MTRLCTWLSLGLWLWPMTGLAAAPSPDADVAALRASFEYGKYAEVLERAAARVDRGGLSEEGLVELHKLAGLSAFNLGRRDAASRHFRALLRLSPDFSLDPFMVPPPAVQAFEDLKIRMAAELELIRQEQRLRAEREREEQDRVERERQRVEEQRLRMEALSRQITVREVHQRSFLVNFVPFGAGQFQQGRTRLGLTFAATEAALALTSILAFFMYDSLFVRETLSIEDRLNEGGQQTVELRYIPTGERRRAEAWRYLKLGSGGAFYAVYALGVADALYHHEDEVVHTRQENRPTTATAAQGGLQLLPSLGRSGAGLTLRF